MSQGRIGKLIAGLAVAALLAAPATVTAQEAHVGPNTGAVTFSLDQKIVTSYIWRGMLQEDRGLIYQPQIGINATLFEGEDFITSLDVYASIWNSIHGKTPAGSNSNKAWFQTDYTVGASLGLPAGFTFDSAVVFKTFPHGAVGAITELNLLLAYDDADLMAGWGLPALNPYALFAIELANAGGGENSYVELGLEPTFAIFEAQDFPITLSIPIAVGLGISNYYGSDTFGHVTFGAVLSTPLNFIPVEFGAWEASAGVIAVFAESGARSAALRSQDEWEVYGTFGLSMTY
jgi:hypothetical protein